MSGILLNTGASSEIKPYKIGSTVELLFQTDEATAIAIGNSLSVDILDVYDNLISTITAAQAGIEPLYIAEYTIPFNLPSLYNAGQVPETIGDPLFHLRDRWSLSLTESLEFPFYVSRAIDQPITDNAEYYVTLEGLIATDNTVMSKTVLHFTSTMYPCYATVQDVIDVYTRELSGVDRFMLARLIMGVSKIVDYHIKPNVEYIYHKDRLDSAISNYVTYQTAYLILSGNLNTSSETKALDTFNISRTVSGDRYLRDLLSLIENYEKIIWAGGKDTPFTSKTFEKGLYDPNRPNVSRAMLDTTGWLPWVNTTTATSLMNVDGSDVEVRGTRSISFSHMLLKNYPFDKGDAGYFAGI